jgi:intergrase/recombinase
LTIKIGLYTGLRQEEIVYLHKTALCTNLGGCTCEKLHVIKKPNAVTVVIMNLFRGHKKCYFTILPTLIFEQFRRVPKFDKADLEVAHKLSKRIANIKFVELRKIHYNVMSRVMDMNEADILAGRAKSVSARHYALYEFYLHEGYNGHYATPLQAGDLIGCTCHLDTLIPGKIPYRRG